MIASLITSLAVTGSRKSDGSVNASGRAWFYQPGTLTPAVVYTDSDATVQATQPITLDAAGKASIYTTRPIRLLVERVVSTGVYATVSDYEVVMASAGNVGVANDGWTGINPDTGATEAGGHTTLDSVLDRLADSFGGTDGKYKEYTGATERKLVEVLRGTQVSVRDYGAVGNGLANDTTAIQNAANEVARLGGGVVYFDPGTYLISSAISLSSKTGVSFRGAGAGASIIKQSHASASALSLSSCTAFFIDDLQVTHSSTSTGSAISMSACQTVRLSGVSIGLFDIGVDVSGASLLTSIRKCAIITNGAAAARAVRYNATGGSASEHYISESLLFASTGACVEYNGTVRSCAIDKTSFGPTKGILFNASLTGTRFALAASPSIADCTTPIDLSGLATDPVLRQWGNEIDGYSVDVTTGGTVTPDRSKGPHIRIRGTTTGSAYVVPAPIPAPRSTMRDAYLVIEFYNNAGGAITGWTLNAAYHTSAGPSTTDGQITTYVFRWDGAVWRENSRTVTT